MRIYAFMVPVQKWSEAERILFSHIRKLRYMFELGNHIIFVFVAPRGTINKIKVDLAKNNVPFDMHWDERRDLDG